MNTMLWMTVTALIVAVPAFASLDQQKSATARPAATSASPLAGTWRSADDRTRLTSSLDESVWGKDATAVRSVEMVVQPAGQARISVNRRVVDAKGRTVAGSASVEEAQIEIGVAKPAVNTRIEHEITMLKAERRYPDDPKTRWPLDGFSVKVVTFEGGDANMLEVRVDTPEGTGSFWETLRRGAARNTTPRTAKP